MCVLYLSISKPITEGSRNHAAKKVEKIREISGMISRIFSPTFLGFFYLCEFLSSWNTRKILCAKEIEKGAKNKQKQIIIPNTVEYNFFFVKSTHKTIANFTQSYGVLENTNKNAKHL